MRADDVEADDRPAASAGRDPDAPNLAAGVQGCDVNAEVLRRQSGSPNDGWALLPWPSGIDGAGIATSEWPSASERSRLTVRDIPGCAPDLNDDGVLDTREAFAFVNAWTAADPAADTNRDGLIDSRDVLACLNLWAAERRAIRRIPGVSGAEFHSRSGAHCPAPG